jgi:hypothetical protein
VKNKLILEELVRITEIMGINVLPKITNGKILKESFNDHELNDETAASRIIENAIDISGESTLPYIPLDSKYFVLHHTASRSTASEVVKSLNCRWSKAKRRCEILGIQWVIDRDAKLYRTLKEGAEGAHLRDQRSGMRQVNNLSAEGVEIIGSNDADITDEQCKTALFLIKKLGYSLSSVFGHGEVSSNKGRTEGQKCKTYATKYWDTIAGQCPPTTTTTTTIPINRPINKNNDQDNTYVKKNLINQNKY